MQWTCPLAFSYLFHLGSGLSVITIWKTVLQCWYWGNIIQFAFDYDLPFHFPTRRFHQNRSCGHFCRHWRHLVVFCTRINHSAFWLVTMGDERIVQTQNSTYVFHACKPTNENGFWPKAKHWCSCHQSLELPVSILEYRHRYRTTRSW